MTISKTHKNDTTMIATHGSAVYCRAKAKCSICLLLQVRRYYLLPLQSSSLYTRFNVGLPSTTLDQHCTSIGSTSCVSWVNVTVTFTALWQPGVNIYMRSTSINSSFVNENIWRRLECLSNCSRCQKRSIFLKIYMYLLTHPRLILWAVYLAKFNLFLCQNGLNPISLSGAVLSVCSQLKRSKSYSFVRILIQFSTCMHTCVWTNNAQYSAFNDYLGQFSLHVCITCL